MEIIKTAFAEGRETDTDWEESKAKRNQIKMSVALENYSTMNNREFHSLIPIQQICPESGNVINTFPSRIAAARHIVNNILERPDKNPVAVTGNMHMCMSNGWKSYGFFWKMVNVSPVKLPTSANAKKVFVIMGRSSTICPSMQYAADLIGVSAKIIKTAITPNSKNKSIPTNVIVQDYQPTLRTLEFGSLKEAADYANCSTATLAKWIATGVSVNNTIYNITNYKGLNGYKGTPSKLYTLYKNNRVVGHYKTITEFAPIIGEHRTTVARKIKSNQKMGNIGQYRVTVKS